MAWASELKKAAPIVSDDYRPSYTAVANIFQKYLRLTSDAHLRMYTEEMKELTVLDAKKQLERELEQVGLAKHIAFDH